MKCAKGATSSFPRKRTAVPGKMPADAPWSWMSRRRRMLNSLETQLETGSLRRLMSIGKTITKQALTAALLRNRCGRGVHLGEPATSTGRRHNRAALPSSKWHVGHAVGGASSGAPPTHILGKANSVRARPNGARDAVTSEDAKVNAPAAPVACPIGRAVNPCNAFPGQYCAFARMTEGAPSRGGREDGSAHWRG